MVGEIYKGSWKIFSFKFLIEQMTLISQLDKEDKKTVLNIIDKMLTNKKFKDFFQKNIAAL
jgi:hypothetical protein